MWHALAMASTVMALKSRWRISCRAVCKMNALVALARAKAFSSFAPYPLGALSKAGFLSDFCASRLL